MFDQLLDSVFYLTGIRFSLKDLLEIGERIFTIKRVFNTKCGIAKKDDRIPPRLKFALEKGVTKDKVLTIDKMLEEYYKFRDWDENGIPKVNKLRELKIQII